MYCPMLSKLEITYMYKHYKEKYEDYIKYIKRWENKCNTDFFARPLDKVEREIKGKYLERLNFLEENEQANIWEFIQ